MVTPHLFTLTGNLLAERTLEFAGWSAGRTQRATGESFQVGGKGINVAKMLSRLGAPNTALCFLGGSSGDECLAWLRARSVAHRAFRSTNATRVGTVVRDTTGQQPETTFLGPDLPPDPAALRECADFLDAQPPDQVLALCGSFPGWPTTAFDPLRAALERWLGRGLLVADTYGPPLGWLSERALSLIKINADELRSLSGIDGASLPPRVQRWVVTDGARPVWVRDGDSPPVTLMPPRVREVSPTGSGDVLLACVIEAMFQRRLALRDAVAFALPYAAANAAHPGIGEFPGPIARTLPP